MKIKDNRQRFVAFSTLKNYDTFCYDEDFYMKIPMLYDGTITYNVFCFNTNRFNFFMPAMEVLLINVTLEVSNYNED